MIEALRLADLLETGAIWQDQEAAAAELRRLHELNAELVKALRSMLYDDDQDEATCKARAALAKVGASK